MRIFLAGIVQGSITEHKLYDQGYRARIRKVLNRTLPGAEVFCPIERHPGALDYDDRDGRSTFFEDAKIAAEADCVIAYLPEASMGTAIEMWEAYNNGHVVLAISPMKENWAVRYLSDKVFESIEEFESFAAGGGLREIVGWSKETEPSRVEAEE